MQFMDGVSQPIFAATNQLVNYPPFLGGYLLSNFIHPVYRLSRTPVSDETPFAGLSPAISASHPYRQLSQPYRLFANDLLLRLLGRNLSLVAANDLLMRPLGRNLSLVASDLHLDTSLSRDLEDAKQWSSVLHGESFPPLLHSLGFRHLRRFLLMLQKMILLRRWSCMRWSIWATVQDMILLKLVPLGDSPTITFTAAAPVQPGPLHPDDDPAYAGPSRRVLRFPFGFV